MIIIYIFSVAGRLLHSQIRHIYVHIYNTTRGRLQIINAVIVYYCTTTAFRFNKTLFILLPSKLMLKLSALKKTKTKIKQQKKNCKFYNEIVTGLS